MVSAADRTMTERRRPDGRTLGLALLVAAAVHVPLAFTALTPRLRYATPQSPVIELQLDRVSPRAPTVTERRPTTAGPATKAAAPPAPATSVPAVPSLAPPKPPPPAGPSAGGSPGLSRALRSSLGCATPDLVDLTAAEREACQHRLAAGYSRTGDAVFSIDPQRQAALDASRKTDTLYQMMQQGYLAEKPRKGCKPVTAQQARVAALGAKEGWSLSLGCAVPF